MHTTVALDAAASAAGGRGRERVRRARRASSFASLLCSPIVLAAALSPAGVTWRSLPRSAAPAASDAAGNASRRSDGVDRAVAAAPGASKVVVLAAPGHADAAARAVTAAGGTVGTALPLVDGFSATMTAAQASAASADPSVRSITLDRVGAFTDKSGPGSNSGQGNALARAIASAPTWARSVDAPTAWAAGNTGAGVGIAVIDTGVAAHDDLAGRVVYGPDLSGEGTTIDSYGHGTVMAGIIAGNGYDAVDAGISPPYTGIAPGATIISVKTAGRNGAADVTTILQALHWVSAYQAQFNIRVVNLSWGVPSTQDPAVDPIDYAVERLWRQGIVVVVAAGNGGPGPTTINKPADDPLVVTVGAYDDKQNTDASDDAVTEWSSRGPTVQGVAKPDVVAPGRSLISPRAFGSTIEQGNAKALYPPSYIRGSGTSHAAAVTSGAAALLIAARPTLTPDQVKGLLTSTASPISGAPATAQGAGRIKVSAAILGLTTRTMTQTPRATGLGSIDASRGGAYVQTVCPNRTDPTVIQGEIDVRCEAWDGSAWTGSSWTGSSWTGSSWTGSSWTGSSWTGSSWTGSSWTGSSWTGGTWTGSSWTGSSWTGSSWTGSSWTGSSWTGSSWTGSSWTGSSWTGSSWTGSSWTSLAWLGSLFSGVPPESASPDPADGSARIRTGHRVKGDDGDGDGDGASFGTVFWGDRPAWWRTVPGEQSDPTPRGRNIPQ